MWTMESDTERAYDFVVGYFAAERTQYIFTGQRWCVGDVPEMARFARQRQRVPEHHSVSLYLGYELQYNSNEIPYISFRKQALAAKIEAEKEGIVVPMTLEDYCIKPKTKPSNQDPPVRTCHLSFVITETLQKKSLQLDMTDFYDEDYDLDTDDEDQQSGESDYGDGDDSGNAES